MDIDSFTLNHAARVLATVAPDMPADAALRRYFVAAHRLGAREKRAISRTTFNYFRWLSWLDAKASMQKQVEQAWQMHERFIDNPSSVKAQALAALAVPTWLAEEVVLPPESLRQLQQEPTLWLRPRLGLEREVSSELGTCVPADVRALGLQVPQLNALHYSGMKDLFVTPAFHHGAFEIQDLASQLVGHACASKPGETWWDGCSGEGGKMLHLADLMQNKGLIWATDRSARRLQSLKRRAARAKIFNFRQSLWDGSSRLPTKTKFNGILLDAPCSGVGTWQRNPHARWSARPADVKELAQVQRNLLEHVANSLKPGGRLIYSVCTLTKSETTAVCDAFTAAHPEFEPIPVLGKTPQLTLWPHELKANGMFISSWKKK